LAQPTIDSLDGPNEHKGCRARIAYAATQERHVNQLYIGGTWRDAADGGTREIRCPANGELVATVAEGTAADAEAAVAAARLAYDEGPWRHTTEKDRGQLLFRLADVIDRDRAIFSRAESLDTGKRLVEADYDMSDVIASIRYFAGIAGTEAGRVVDAGNDHAISRIVYSPVGVCALITPWNYPLLQTSWKVAPALLAGNTFVLKPAELTPSTAILLMDTLAEAGLPAGVANLVTGAGSAVGPVLTSDPRVDMVSFTGGLVTGRAVMAAAAPTVKRVALELGGKNPNIVFADADREAALDNALTAVFLHSGQVCSAGARLLVEESIHDEFVAELAIRAELIVLGGPEDEKTETGPLISFAHRDKVHSYVQRALEQGAVLRCGGRIPTDAELAAGSFYPPTILDRCTATMDCVREESFGPVLTVETFSTEAEAVRLANDTDYGLAGAVWTQDAGKSQRVAGALRAGTVWINDYHPYVPQAEWGGFKQSGIGRELGPTGLAEYREIKHIWHNVDPQPQQWFRG
jgi:betaine-aldehyde dehydrogenase